MTRESMKTKLLATTLFVGVSGGLWAGAAIAQETDEAPVAVPTADAEDESVQDRIVVTGSRLQRPADTAIAVTTIGSDYLDSRTFTNAIEAIEELPLAALGTNLEGANFANNDFTANANLLNLGTNRTLTLVNGRRFVSSNQATVFVPGNSNGAQVDLSLINPALIDRVEAVAGPAYASTYGADAVGGVINIILKDDFEGFDITAQGGITGLGDGEQYRISGLAGRNFLNDRANVTFGVEWSDTSRIGNDETSRPEANSFSAIVTPFTQGGGVFDPGPSTLLVPNTTFAFNSANGLLVGGFQFGGIAATSTVVPNTQFPVGGTAARFRDAFTAFQNQFGASPFVFAQNGSIDPLALLGTFGGTGGFLQVPNPGGGAALPFVAVPLQFNTNGDLVPFNVGSLTPPNPSDQNSFIGGDGILVSDFGTIRGEQERLSLNLATRFDITPDITYKGEYFYANIDNSTLDGFNSNTPFGSTTGGTLSIPVYIDQNPFLSAQAVQTIDNLQAQGLVVPTSGGQRRLFLSRALTDIDGGIDETSESDFYRTAQEIAGEFNLVDRAFNWDAAFTYGRVERENGADTLLDIEFALATDVVADANGNPVCRQQTLAAPESVAIRNGGLAFINNVQGLIPTQAQIDACVPLNLFGSGSPSQAAIDYVSSSTASDNTSEQFLAALQFGGELIELPGGTSVFSLQGEYRKEENEFIPGTTFAQGLGRATTGQGSQGELEFLEGGLELNVPILGGDFSLPFARLLEFDGAVRVVSRVGESQLTGFQSDRVTDVVYRAGGRFSPVDWLTFRGSQSTSIRSPSIVELFGAGVTGFSAAGRGNANPCDLDAIDGGPAGGIRRTNCEAFAAQLGLPADFLDTFQAEAGAAPAAGASNPLLANEGSEAWTVGVVFQPDFIPGLTFQADYYDLQLTDEIQLTSIASECFDQPSFPNSTVDGLLACNALVFGVPGATPGTFVVPAINPITGAAVLPVANPGSPAQTQQPLNSTFTFFDTLNLRERELEAVNIDTRYTFDLDDVLGGRASNWGGLTLGHSLYYVIRYDFITGGVVDPQDGESGNPTVTSRLDITHSVGKLNHTLQWFFTDSTVANVLTANPSTQALSFAQPSFSQLNYNVQYQATENVSIRFVVNNLTNNFLDAEAGLGSNGLGRGDAIGRRFSLAINARF